MLEHWAVLQFLGLVDLQAASGSLAVVDEVHDFTVQPANPMSLGGLGEALDVARNKEKIISPSDLPPDMDEILKAVRNNLIHLSNESLETDLTKISTLSVATVREFVANEELVFDLISDVPEFINNQYVKLWKAGEKI